MVALLAPALLAVAAMIADMGFAYAKLGLLQQAGDSAALAGAMTYSTTHTTSTLQAAVQDVVTANGWSSTTIQSPSAEYLATSPVHSSASAVQVVLVATTPAFFGASMLGFSNLTLRTSSIVELQSAGSPACILSLTSLIVNSSINTGSCGVAADSNVLVNGGGRITASQISSYLPIINNGTITGTVVTGQVVADPYTSYQAQAQAGFSGACSNYANQTTLSPGCWQNVNVNQGALTLTSGTYFFKGININSGGSLVATGGTTVVTQNNFSPNGNVSITAPTSGAWAGMALYAMGGVNMNSGVTYTINGALYSPTTALNLNSGTWNQSACTYLVASQITFNSNSAFTLPQSNCSSYGYPVASTSGGGGAAIALVQ